jgi:hypothetical protein
VTRGPVADLVEVGDLFAELAREVDARWDDRADDAAFTRAATGALADADLPVRLPVAAALTYLAAGAGLPPVVPGENEYGQPTVTVWRGDDFHVEVIVWSLGAIALHDHVNAGAFVPLSGTRFHTRFDFVPTGTWADAFTVGDLSRRAGEVLRAGDARGIAPGAAFLHDLVFCDERCVTVSVRRRAASGDSASYLLPGLRLPNLALPGRRAQALDHLRDHDGPSWNRALERMVATSPDTAVFALRALCGILAPAELGRVVQRIVGTWGGDVEWWAGLVGEIVRRSRLERLLPLADPEARVALAALRAGVDGADAEHLGLAPLRPPDDEHGTVARTRAALGWP